MNSTIASLPNRLNLYGCWFFHYNSRGKEVTGKLKNTVETAISYPVDIENFVVNYKRVHNDYADKRAHIHVEKQSSDVTNIHVCNNFSFKTEFSICILF